MSHAAAIRKYSDQRTGARTSVVDSKKWTEVSTPPTAWQENWHEMFRTQAIKNLPQSSMPLAMSFAIDALPIAEMMVASTTRTMLNAIEMLFGGSATNLAKMLRVSRPMVYHYREGMEPSDENRRRLQLLASLASELGSQAGEPVKGALKARQSSGRTLLDFLSDESLDVTALRQMIRRSVDMSDKAVRSKLAGALAQRESVADRGDVMRARHAEGKPVYIGDPEASGKLIQIRPDGTRIRGRMIRRQFVPDEE